jgi:hypothetical protein
MSIALPLPSIVSATCCIGMSHLTTLDRSSKLSFTLLLAFPIVFLLLWGMNPLPDVGQLQFTCLLKPKCSNRLIPILYHLMADPRTLCLPSLCTGLGWAHPFLIVMIGAMIRRVRVPVFMVMSLTRSQMHLCLVGP